MILSATKSGAQAIGIAGAFGNDQVVKVLLAATLAQQKLFGQNNFATENTSLMGPQIVVTVREMGPLISGKSIGW